MCILCDHETLELLTTPLDRLRPGDLADAIRAARDAAAPGVLDHAESVLRGEAPSRINLEIFEEVVVDRAMEAGVLSSADAYAWGERLRRERTAPDPRALAFVAACAEIIDEYALMVTERRQVLERFVEAHGDSAAFAWLGRDGELWFDYRGELYCVLSESEALEIAEQELSTTLHSLGAEELLRYTTLPDTGLEVLEGIRAKPTDVANSLLAGLIDLAALADDRVRSMGFAPFFLAEQGRPVEDLRFGEWVILRALAE
jgi:hypothetical protein